MRSEDAPLLSGQASPPSTHAYTFYKSSDPVQQLEAGEAKSSQSTLLSPQAIFKSSTFKTENGKCAVLYILFK